jgi:hypothetical protein
MELIIKCGLFVMNFFTVFEDEKSHFFYYDCY